MTTLLLNPIANAERKATEDIGVIPAAAASGQDAGLRLPLFIPRSQLYYWTREWQSGEAEALDDIVHGRVRRFSSGTDAAAWLLADEA
jgi:hypothetical protein